jgi:hypothetical protein
MFSVITLVKKEKVARVVKPRFRLIFQLFNYKDF